MIRVFLNTGHGELLHNNYENRLQPIITRYGVGAEVGRTRLTSTSLKMAAFVVVFLYTILQGILFSVYIDSVSLLYESIEV